MARSTGMPGFADAGFAPGSVTGYRWWTLPAPDFAFSSATAGRHWPVAFLQGMRDTWRPGVNEAQCLAGRGGGYWSHPPEDIPSADCGCITPGTRILTADLNWVPAGDLAVGEHLFAFDEYPADHGYRRAGGRKYRSAVVASNERGPLPCYDLTFEDGTEVRVSADHKWLVYSGNKSAHWVRTDELRSGEKRASRVVKPFTQWEPLNSREAGYLAAAFDGEGHLCQSSPRYQFRIGFTQAKNQMLAETERCLKELGFRFTHQVAPRGYNKPLRVDGTGRLDMHYLTMTARPEMIRFLGSVRPVRLLPKFQPDLLGRMNMTNRVRLVSKRYAGEHEVVKLGTTTGTYFAEGLASHNCGFWAYWQLQHHEGISPSGAALPVCGVVQGFGQVLIGTRGFRCSKARITALHLPFTITPDFRALGGDPFERAGFTGRVIHIGDGPRVRQRQPTPEELRTAADEAEAWIAVIGDRLAQLYPDAVIYETREAMLARHPPDPLYGT